MATNTKYVKFSDFVNSLDAASESDVKSKNNLPIITSSVAKKMDSKTVGNLISNIASEFNSSVQYKAGDFFEYNSKFYEVIYDFTGSFDSSKVRSLTFEQLLKMNFYRNRPLVWSGIGTESEKNCVDKLSNSILDAKITILDDTDYDTFWKSGYESPNGKYIDKRYIGIAQNKLSNNKKTIKFWIMRNLQGDFADSSYGNCNLFNVTENDGVTIYDNVKYVSKNFTWSGTSLNVELVVNWNNYVSFSSNVAKNYLANEIVSIEHSGLISTLHFINSNIDFSEVENINKSFAPLFVEKTSVNPYVEGDFFTLNGMLYQVKKDFFGQFDSSKVRKISLSKLLLMNKFRNRPLIWSGEGDYPSGVVDMLSKSILDAEITIVDDTDFDTFWNEGYDSPNGVHIDHRYIGVAIVSSKRRSLRFWMMSSIVGDYAGSSYGDCNLFDINEGDGNVIYGNVKYYSRNFTWSGTNLKYEIVVDWDSISFDVSGNVSYNYLSKEIVSIEHCGLIATYKQIKSNLASSVLPNFSNLVIGVDGDSITAGNQWSYYACQILGVSKHQNVGVGSAFYSCRRVVYDGVTYTTQEYNDPNFSGIANGTIAIDSPEAAQKTANNCARCHVGKFIANVESGAFSAPDIFCFSFGTNDSVPSEEQIEYSISSSDLPSISDSMNMAGGMRYCIQKIKQTYPNCKIFVLLPIQSYNSQRNVKNMLKIEAIKKIACAMSVPVIDMYGCCGISGVLENGSGPYLYDGLHPNESGQKLMGSFAAESIISLYGRKL